MKFSILVVAILAFSTLIDLSEASLHCYTDLDNKYIAECDWPKKCYAYADTSGNIQGKCDTAGCDDPVNKLWCKECTTDRCNTKSTVAPKCYVRNSGATTEGTADTACTATPPAVKCVSYYDASGNNLGKCLDGGCGHTDITTTSLHCKECTTYNCNVRSLIRKCYVRTTSTTSGDGTSTNCATTMANPKCVSYFDAAGKNLGECAVDCTGKANCQSCGTDNCNVKSIVTTTTAAPTTAAGGAAPTTTAAGGAAPTTTAAGGAAPTTPRAAATRASVGWQTEIMAASVCVLALMKPF